MSVSQKVLVLGLGASGRTAARFYASRGFEVLAADTRPQPPRLDELQKEIPPAGFPRRNREPAIRNPLC